MSGEEVMFCYLGTVGIIVILNAVEWGIYRDSIYALFTFQTLPSFINAAIFSLDLPSLARNLTYDVTLALLHVSYIALVNRLFNLAQRHPRLHGQGFRSLVQIGGGQVFPNPVAALISQKQSLRSRIEQVGPVVVHLERYGFGEGGAFGQQPIGATGTVGQGVGMG